MESIINEKRNLKILFFRWGSNKKQGTNKIDRARWETAWFAKNECSRMDKKNSKRTKRKNQLVKGTMYISPDGGETVYEQNKNGTRGKIVSQTQLAKDIETTQDESEMIGAGAIELRRKYPTLQNAWDKYKTVWHLVIN
jgi:hypothetical protein